MSINVQGQVKVKCGRCENEQPLSPEELDWDCIETEERAQGAEHTHETEFEKECDCGNTITGKITAWEYPEGVFNHADYEEVTNGKIIGKFKISFDMEMAPEDNFL